MFLSCESCVILFILSQSAIGLTQRPLHVGAELFRPGEADDAE
jgi:hypothetical protein